MAGWKAPPTRVGKVQPLAIDATEFRSARSVIIRGAGVLGLWQALRLAEADFRVRLVDQADAPFAGSASRLAGAMLAPDCEAEAAPVIVRDIGRTAIAAWRRVYPGVVNNGTLVVAAARDTAELTRFRALTERHMVLDREQLRELEPDISERFSAALYYPDEAHMAAPAALEYLLDAFRTAGGEVKFGQQAADDPGAIIIDCRGFAARNVLPDLRGVRGERIIVRTDEIKLSRPVRLLHPRQPIYVVPWGDGRFMVGATVIEREDDGEPSVRSVLELLGALYALHPAFAEAEIEDIAAGIRPAFPDNVPRVIVREGGRRLYVNGAWRHGFLMAPALADATLAFLADGTTANALLRVET